MPADHEWSRLQHGRPLGAEAKANRPAFIEQLARHPAFARRIRAIVLEFGNARWQAEVDRYVNGGPSPTPRCEL